MRRELRIALDASGLPSDEGHDLLLAACEAATNAVEHAQHPTEPYFDVSLELSDGRGTIVVRDHGQWRGGSIGAHRGRGLAMMSTLADTSLTSRASGTTVTMRSHPVGTGFPGRQPVPK